MIDPSMLGSLSALQNMGARYGQPPMPPQGIPPQGSGMPVRFPGQGPIPMPPQQPVPVRPIGPAYPPAPMPAPVRPIGPAYPINPVYGPSVGPVGGQYPLPPGLMNLLAMRGMFGQR